MHLRTKMLELHDRQAQMFTSGLNVSPLTVPPRTTFL